MNYVQSEFGEMYIIHKLFDSWAKVCLNLVRVIANSGATDKVEDKISSALLLGSRTLM